jgi:hypothetical protein
MVGSWMRLFLRSFSRDRDNEYTVCVDAETENDADND